MNRKRRPRRRQSGQPDPGPQRRGPRPRASLTGEVLVADERRVADYDVVGAGRVDTEEVADLDPRLDPGPTQQRMGGAGRRLVQLDAVERCKLEVELIRTAERGESLDRREQERRLPARWLQHPIRRAAHRPVSDVPSHWLRREECPPRLPQLSRVRHYGPGSYHVPHAALRARRFVGGVPLLQGGSGRPRARQSPGCEQSQGGYRVASRLRQLTPRVPTPRPPGRRVRSNKRSRRSSGSTPAEVRGPVHGHQLQRPVTATCLCCQVDYVFTFKSSSDHVLCRGCERHQGDSKAKLQLKDRDHVALWRSEVQLQAEEAAEREAVLESQVKSLKGELTEMRVEASDLRETVRRGFNEAPVLAVEKWLAGEAVNDAHDRRDAAYRTRDRALRAIWALDRLHRASERDEHQCVCGTRMSKCREAAVLEAMTEALWRWESDQIDRLRRGLACGLPDDHPEVRKRGLSYGRLAR